MSLWRYLVWSLVWLVELINQWTSSLTGSIFDLIFFNIVWYWFVIGLLARKFQRLSHNPMEAVILGKASMLQRFCFFRVIPSVRLRFTFFSLHFLDYDSRQMCSFEAQQDSL